MTTGRVVLTGKTRTCPHCKSTILESSSVCPACQHHLRFDPKGDPRSEELVRAVYRVLDGN